MAILSQQLADAAAALNIAGVPAIAQLGVPVTATLSPPLTAVQFTDFVNTDVSLDFVAKDVVFQKTDITDPAFAGDPALVKIKPLFNLATVPPATDTSGTGGLIGKIVGTIAMPVPVNVAPKLTVVWTINGDPNGYVTPNGTMNPTLDILFLPQFVVFEGVLPPPAIYKISAVATLTAAGESGAATVGPIDVAVPALPFPKVLVLSRHKDFHGAALVMAPGNSAINSINHLKQLLQPVRNAISTLTTIAQLAEMMLGIEAISGALENGNIAFTKADQVSNLNDIDLITKDWYALNDIEAE